MNDTLIVIPAAQRARANRAQTAGAPTLPDGPAPSGFALPDLEPWPTELDARGLRPVNTFQAVLTALSSIPDGHPQYVRTRTRPDDLLAKLAARGVEAASSESPDGTWRTALRGVGENAAKHGARRS